MAESNNSGRPRVNKGGITIFDPYGAYNFIINIGSINVAGFSECTGLNMDTKIFEYKEGGNNATTLKFIEHTTYGNITLKKGITHSNELIQWYLKIINGDYKESRRSIKIHLSGSKIKGNTVKKYELIKAFPVKWSGPDLKAAAGEIAIETLEISHEGISIGL